jgi:Domain of unknown function (DUF4055)
MSVTTTSPRFSQHVEKWTRCRDTISGGDAVKAQGQKYLPRLEGMDPNDSVAYEAYKARALFYPAGGRTVAGLTGLCFAHPITVAGTDVNEMRDVTGAAHSLEGFARELCQELWTVGRGGVLLDMPAEQGGKPFWIRYDAEHIINYRMQRVAGEMKLTLVVLLETYDEQVDGDDFTNKKLNQYRVLRLIGGQYAVTVWRQPDASRDAWVEGNIIDGVWTSGAGPLFPVRRGVPLDFIPFIGFTSQKLTLAFEEPPLLALVDVNLSHYRTSADHEHGAHFTALPTPYVTGADVQGALVIGSGSAWVFPRDTARVGMLEYTGQGLGALKDLKEEKRLLMVTLGARMLETQKNAAEAAATVRLRHAGEASALSVLASTLSTGLTWLLQKHLWWAGMDDVSKAIVMLNPEVMDDLTAADMQALVATWQSGAISHKTLYENLKWGEWTRPGIDFDEELKEIGNEGAGGGDL